jgi:hypothetical protein
MPEQIPDMLGMAIQSALSNRSVLVFVIPGDILLSPAPYTKPIQ